MNAATQERYKNKSNFDVQQFRPHEISGMVTDDGKNNVTIEGKHKEKEDEHWQIYRHFIQKLYRKIVISNKWS